MRTLRVLPSITALLAATTLAACTTNSSVCKDGVCKISLSGKGSSTTLGDNGSPVELISATGTTAKMKIGTDELTVDQGQTISLDNGEIKVTEVKDDKVKLEVTQTSESSSDSSSSDAESGSDSSGDAAQ